MKIVASGDWHLDMARAGYDFHDDIVRALNQVVDATQGADLFVHLGDLFDNDHPSPRAYMTAMEALHEVPCPVVIVPGNHDPYAWAPLQHMGREILIANWPSTYDILGKSFLIAGYLTDAEAKAGGRGKSAQQVVDEAFVDARSVGVKAAFCHLDFMEAVVGENTTMRFCGLQIPAEALISTFPIINGHIHKQQQVQSVHCPGSLVPGNVGERLDVKGYVELEV